MRWKTFTQKTAKTLLKERRQINGKTSCVNGLEDLLLNVSTTQSDLQN